MGGAADIADGIITSSPAWIPFACFVVACATLDTMLMYFWAALIASKLLNWCLKKLWGARMRGSLLDGRRPDGCGAGGVVPADDPFYNTAASCEFVRGTPGRNSVLGPTLGDCRGCSDFGRGYSESSGMPSGHSQMAATFAVYTGFVVWTRGLVSVADSELACAAAGDKVALISKVVTTVALAAGSMAVFYHRAVTTNCHSWAQVAAGAGVGALVGWGAFELGEHAVRPWIDKWRARAAACDTE